MITKFLLAMLLFPFASGDSAQGCGGTAQNSDPAVAAAVESFRTAMVDANAAMLEKLLADDLSYGHSDGKVEGKKDLIDKMADGRYDFVNMDLTEQTIMLSGDIAVVRHKLDGKTADNGKPNEAHLYVLMIWQKTKKEWKLLARQAVKQFPPAK